MHCHTSRRDVAFSFRGRGSWLVSCSIIAATTTAQSAAAQSAAPVPPIASPVDDNGVNLATGQPTVSLPALTIGTKPDSILTFRNIYNNGTLINSYYIAIENSGNTAIVIIGGTSVNFTLGGGAYSPVDGNGETLVYNSGNYTYTYTARDGTIINFSTSAAQNGPLEYNGTIAGVATNIISPNGETTNLYYDTVTTAGNGDVILTYIRLQAVQNSSGEMLSLTYGTN